MFDAATQELYNQLMGMVGSEVCFEVAVDTSQRSELPVQFPVGTVSRTFVAKSTKRPCVTLLNRKRIEGGDVEDLAGAYRTFHVDNIRGDVAVVTKKNCAGCELLARTKVGVYKHGGQPKYDCQNCPVLSGMRRSMQT